MNGSTPQTWQDIALALFDKLTGRDAEITYTAKDLVIHVPEETGATPSHTPWIISGTLTISTRDARE